MVWEIEDKTHEDQTFIKIQQGSGEDRRRRRLRKQLKVIFEADNRAE